MGKSLGTQVLTLTEYVREVVTTYEKGIPVRVQVFHHVVDDTTGVEVSRSADTIQRLDGALDADTALKSAVAVLPAIGDRLKTEDIAAKAAEVAKQAAEAAAVIAAANEAAAEAAVLAALQPKP